MSVLIDTCLPICAWLQGAHTGQFMSNARHHLGRIKNELMERLQRQEKNVRTTNGGAGMSQQAWRDEGSYHMAGLTRQFLATYVAMKVKPHKFTRQVSKFESIP
eukprot:TRINITY_DN10675_c0_g3_i1.p1 TRINITY_DN10675_c0_g3~~TRINITY_DN10675_c0_g3_i1.p1  ORF type:complete len:104 (-),score=11.30 TRINITY_DN10675_c0_g3_i1:92-403(-)